VSDQAVEHVGCTRGANIWSGEHGLAILPSGTHYDINVVPALPPTVAGFLDKR
jgi:hypothetical protein